LDPRLVLRCDVIGEGTGINACVAREHHHRFDAEACNHVRALPAQRSHGILSRAAFGGRRRDERVRGVFSRLYEPYCSNQDKLRMVGPNPDDVLDMLSVNVSN
jgi:hypothetical protein